MEALIYPCLLHIDRSEKVFRLLGPTLSDYIDWLKYLLSTTFVLTITTVLHTYNTIQNSIQCLVTGASSGIGKATCEILTKYGATVVGTGRNESALSELKDKGFIADFVAADLTAENKCEEVVKESVRLLDGKLTCLVNCAGRLKGGAMGDVDLSNYQMNMAINTQVPFEMMTHSIPFLKNVSSSSIVNISSVNGKQAFMGCVSYCMSKAAVDQLTRCASVDLAQHGIRVNAINPGVVETNLQKVSIVLFS